MLSLSLAAQLLIGRLPWVVAIYYGGHVFVRLAQHIHNSQVGRPPIHHRREPSSGVKKYLFQPFAVAHRH